MNDLVKLATQDILYTMKFNDTVVALLINKQGEELGKWIATFKKSWHTEEHFKYWILTTGQPDIENAIKIFDKHWNTVLPSNPF